MVDKCSVTVCVVIFACYACLFGVARLSNNALCLCDLVTYFYCEGKVLSLRVTVTRHKKSSWNSVHRLVSVRKKCFREISFSRGKMNSH